MKFNVAILGATGAVGADLLGLLEERSFPVEELRAFASEASRGKTLTFRGEGIPVEVAGPGAFDGIDVAFFSAGSARSLTYAPQAVRSGAVVIDNSSAFRMDPDVPLVIPEINPEALAGHRGIIANPNCTTIVTLMAAAPLIREAGAISLRAASYQAASGAGARAMEELSAQIRAIAAGEPVEVREFAHQLALNVIPHVGGFLPGGETEEEAKLRDESRKILGLPELPVCALCVRVPVPRAHSVAVWLETVRPLTPDRARDILAAAPGVSVVDDPMRSVYPMPILAAGRASVQVGRLRADESAETGLVFFVSGDQLLKGAALNAIQIAEALTLKGLSKWQP
jgi:aspartate-semialdehyde dehydrogenase